uniref:Uncharacterized protein n=1 Tax=Anguilla anguilla TaxID=7936 RepID=A0A0E9QAF2_ANGAN
MNFFHIYHINDVQQFKQIHPDMGLVCQQYHFMYCI